ncbi:hypothetical protein ACOJBM_31895 [Rhizobium beringeri]
MNSVVGETGVENGEGGVHVLVLGGEMRVGELLEGRDGFDLVPPDGYRKIDHVLECGFQGGLTIEVMVGVGV